MATKSLKFCRHRGCGELTPNAYCEQHQAEHELRLQAAAAAYDRGRGTSAQRGYDGAWRRARDAWLRQHPLCERCQRQGIITVATLVHHKKGIRHGGARLDSDNFESLCFDCHEITEGRKRS